MLVIVDAVVLATVATFLQALQKVPACKYYILICGTRGTKTLFWKLLSNVDTIMNSSHTQTHATSNEYHAPWSMVIFDQAQRPPRQRGSHVPLSGQNRCGNHGGG